MPEGGCGVCGVREVCLLGSISRPAQASIFFLARSRTNDPSMVNSFFSSSCCNFWIQVEKLFLVSIFMAGDELGTTYLVIMDMAASQNKDLSVLIRVPDDMAHVKWGSNTNIVTTNIFHYKNKSQGNGDIISILSNNRMNVCIVFNGRHGVLVGTRFLL